MKINKKGFTLIELIIAMVILAVLSGLIAGGVLNSLKKGRDARRKADLQQIQRALEFYYEDNRTYPSSLTFGGQIVGPAPVSKVYMQKVPIDPNTSKTYYYCYETVSSPTKYKLYAVLENENDSSRMTTAPSTSGFTCLPSSVSSESCGASPATPCIGISGSDTTP